MPPLGFYDAQGHNVHFCEKCKDKIEYALRDTVYLPFQIGTCNNFNDHEQRWKFFAHRNVFINKGNGGQRIEQWKFCNDSRRQFLKFLKEVSFNFRSSNLGSS